MYTRFAVKVKSQRELRNLSFIEKTKIKDKEKKRGKKVRESGVRVLHNQEI